MMAQNDGVPGQAVTPLVDGVAVSAANPLPVDVVVGGGGTIKFFNVTPTGLGANTVVAAVVGKKIRVISWILDNNGVATSANFFTAGVGTAISSKGTLVLGGSNASPSGLFETVAGELLGIDMGAATAGATLSGSYVEVS